MLYLKQVEVMYQHIIQVLRGVSLKVEDEQIVCLLGANGAGKSTTLKAISGLLIAEDGRITEGSVEFDKNRIDNKWAYEVAKQGILQVVEGRSVLLSLTVEENLRLGHLGKQKIRSKLDMVYQLFPKLKYLNKRSCGFLSGGEQQMVVIGRALMGEPRLLMLDEPSLGLSPILVKDIFATIKRINVENKTSILLVEQNATVALEIADYAYVMENGQIVMDGTAESIRSNPDIKEFYLGLNDLGSKKSYKDVKHYRRRKRWL